MMELSKLIQFLQKLDKHKIHYTLAHHRPTAIMVIVTVPGQIWEVEFHDDGEIEIEKFISDGDILGEEELSVLFRDFAN